METEGRLQQFQMKDPMIGAQEMTTRVKLPTIGLIKLKLRTEAITSRTTAPQITWMSTRDKKGRRVERTQLRNAQSLAAL